MALSSSLGFPRIGAKRTLKTALESFWKGDIDETALQDTARTLRAAHWQLQKTAGIHHIPSNDFSFYDQVLDTSALVGAIPPRYHWKGGNVDLATYFAIARGSKGVPAAEMTKWFDTNYHYIVPEFSPNQKFQLSSTKPVDEFLEAKALGITTRPVLIGPVTYLTLGKAKGGDFALLTLLENLLPVYAEILKRLADAGAEWVQLDEPVLALDATEETRKALAHAYQTLRVAAPSLKILIATYFEGLRDNAAAALALPVDALHVDLVRAPQQLDELLPQIPKHLSLSLGLVDGRNIWRCDVRQASVTVQRAVQALGTDRILVGPSCSLLHAPVDLEHETKLDTEVKSWLAFAKQKLGEIAALTKAANGDSIDAELQASDAIVSSRKSSTRIHSQAVKQCAAAVTGPMLQRKSPFSKRRPVQRERLQLPAFPTTTIGSFPQTAEVRKARASFKKGDTTQAQYDQFLREETERCVRFQEEVGLDVLVHGEFERNDMVEYFGEQLAGFTFTQNGWVQSYGSRCVKPPVIYGDVSRPQPMTVEWSRYAQSLTQKPMKGMLTGPVTILQWSFVRNDQPRSETCKQIALAIRDEVVDLEAAGISVVQIDEPAIREGLPLRREDWNAYLRWAVDAFRLSASGVTDQTQIHTHMCYAEFNDIIHSVAEMDADVISIETSRSQMELLQAFVDFKYPNEIGPGVYDIHSPRVPSVEEMGALLKKAAAVIPLDQLWVNPDCGLKTRAWAETKAALILMVQAAREMREGAAPSKTRLAQAGSVS